MKASKMAMALGSVVLCLVVGISDGDTLTAKCAEETVKIRLAEIDAPEKKQPFGAVSKSALSTLCFQQNAQIHAQSKDRYGRIVAHVNCDGRDASSNQLRTGMAWVYDKYVRNQELYQLQAQARAKQVGLWRDASSVAPWEWRNITKDQKKKSNQVKAN